MQAIASNTEKTIEKGTQVRNDVMKPYLQIHLEKPYLICRNRREQAGKDDVQARRYAWMITNETRSLLRICRQKYGIGSQILRPQRRRSMTAKRSIIQTTTAFARNM
jgi:hypothetical protein